MDTPYTYYLPPERIAHTAVEPRESARLLRWPVGDVSTYADLPDYLNAGDLLVVNESKVLPARLYGQRKNRVVGQPVVKVELLLHRPLDTTLTRWEALAKPMKRLSVGDVIYVDGDAAVVVEAIGDGFCHVKLEVAPAEVESYLQAHGHTPLPPYIVAEDTPEVRARYQTVYASTVGSVAAPTAGLHFSSSLLEALKAKGVDIAKVTLHVGAGTFLNPTSEQLAAGRLHKEWCSVLPETAAAITACKARGNKVIAVGTTTCRTLESAALVRHGERSVAISRENSLEAFAGETDLLIRPGFEFKVVDRLITNFHLPGSSLLMLVAAFVGKDSMKALYSRAIAENMRFYSFGDGCLLTRAG
ncbi:MAG: tRNA preQ1(34) S-adenosylmethionine ribosyltransferase-isomerase QueA [Alphaproteobacteria bacterium]